MTHTRGTRDADMRAYGIFRARAAELAIFGSAAEMLIGDKITPVGLPTYAQMSMPAMNDNEVTQ